MHFVHKIEPERMFYLICLIILIAVNPSFSIDSLQVQWSTYIGGSEGGENNTAFRDELNGMVTDDAGNLYVAGWGWTTNLYGKSNDHTTQHKCAFVTKLNSLGMIQWTTYVGGAPVYADGSQGNGICIDSNGDVVYITGYTPTNTDFPAILNLGWGYGAFVTAISTSNGQIQWSRILTSNAYAMGNAIVMYDNHLFVTGSINRWGELWNPINDASGNGDAFVYKLSTDGNIISCRFYGGSFGGESGKDIFVDSQNNIFLVGDIFWEYGGTDYDLPNELNEWRGGSSWRDAFLCRLGPDLQVNWSRYIGGQNDDYAHNITGDDQGNLWVAGRTCSDDLEGIIVEPYNWSDCDGYLTRIGTGGNVEWVSYVNKWGGWASKPKLTQCRKILSISKDSPSGHALLLFDADLGYHQWFMPNNFYGPHCYDWICFQDIDIDEDMNIYICGHTPCPGFINRTNEHSGKDYDGFVMKTSPKGDFYHFNRTPIGGWDASDPDCWTFENKKYRCTGLVPLSSTIRNTFYEKEFYNFSYTAQLIQTSGDTDERYGLNFRTHNNDQNGYRFGIISTGQYYVEKIVGGSSTYAINWTSTTALKQGPDRCNELKVVARDSMIIFSINGVIVDTLEHQEFLYGKIGLFAGDSPPLQDIFEFDNVLVTPYPYIMIGIEDSKQGNALPLEYRLEQNYPNPFNPATTIEYSIAEESRVTLKIYNMLGEEVMTLVDILQQRGTHSVQWNGMTAEGFSCPSGLYVCKLKAGEYIDSKKIMLIR
ncbi:SBBP repeat-containing protein [candidate division KSB1 bacterium]|nr:SBBP repeat-containing protein [candidate division KSB1 bacterium]